MSIEVSAARFSFGKAVMPPKEDKAVISPPPPGWLFEDAKRCNAGLYRQMGGGGVKEKRVTRSDGPTALQISVNRGRKTAAKILAALGEGSLTTRQVAELCSLGIDGARDALNRMEDRGEVRSVRCKHNRAIWHRIEIAPQASQDRPETAISTFRGASIPKHTSAPRGGVGGKG